ncbi:hypothetical protein E4U33_001207, partial [Claviceps sp. LM78 group G4]
HRHPGCACQRVLHDYPGDRGHTRKCQCYVLINKTTSFEEMQAPDTLPGWEGARLESSELVFGDCFEESSEDEDDVDADNVVRQEY